MEVKNERTLLYVEEVEDDIIMWGSRATFGKYMIEIVQGCKMQIPQITDDVEKTFKNLFSEEFAGYSTILCKLETLISISGSDVIDRKIIDMCLALPNYCLIRTAVLCMEFMDDEKSNDKLLELLETSNLDITPQVIEALKKRQNINNIPELKRIYDKRFSEYRSWGTPGFIEYSACQTDLKILIEILEENQ